MGPLPCDRILRGVGLVCYETAWQGVFSYHGGISPAVPHSMPRYLRSRRRRSTAVCGTGAYTHGSCPHVPLCRPRVRGDPLRHRVEEGKLRIRLSCPAARPFLSRSLLMNGRTTAAQRSSTVPSLFWRSFAGGSFSRRISPFCGRMGEARSDVQIISAFIFFRSLVRCSDYFRIYFLLKRQTKEMSRVWLMIESSRVWNRSLRSGAIIFFN